MSFKKDSQCQRVMRKNCTYCSGYNFWRDSWRHDFDCPVYQMKKPAEFLPAEEPCDCDKCRGLEA